MSQLRNVHLFNCDRTYKLDAVEGLLNGMKAKLGLASVEKHNFSLSQMSEMSTKTIPKLQMDLAFFVVHAHESRLSINEDNAGIGYAKIYRALLDATEGNVIIVIGGDDNYKNEDEEDRVVISRWARRKISSQFNEEFLDGRNSFIFSWNKKHREIHEEALLHYFDPNKKGKKFEYQPKPKQAEKEPSGQRSPMQKAQSVSEQSGTAGRNRPLQRAQSVTEPRTADSLFSPFNSAEQRREDSLFSSLNSAEKRTADSLFSPFNSTEPRKADSLFSSFNSAEQRREDKSDSKFRARASTSPSNSKQGARPKEVPPLSTGTELKDLAILGCNVSSTSIQAVRIVLQDIATKLNLSESPPVENLPLDEAKRYLARNKLKFCVLVVDAETIKGATDKSKVEYEELLETAANEVVEKVIILLYDTCSQRDEAIVNETIGRIINKTGKGLKAWRLKNGKLNVPPKDLVQFLTSTVAQQNPQRDFQTSADVASGSVAYSCDTNLDPSRVDHTRPPLERDVTSRPWSPPVNTGRESVMLKTQLRKGRISYQAGDVQIWWPRFEVPDHIIQSLWEKHCHTPEAVVKIIFINGDLQWSVDSKSKESPEDKGIHLAANETVMLHTRVRYGQVSSGKGDLEFIYRDWKVPQYIIQILQRDYKSTRNRELYIISDEQGNLRHITKG